MLFFALCSVFVFFFLLPLSEVSTQPSIQRKNETQKDKLHKHRLLFFFFFRFFGSAKLFPSTDQTPSTGPPTADRARLRARAARSLPRLPLGSSKSQSCPLHCATRSRMPKANARRTGGSLFFFVLPPFARKLTNPQKTTCTTRGSQGGQRGSSFFGRRKSCGTYLIVPLFFVVVLNWTPKEQPPFCGQLDVSHVFLWFA